MNHPATIQKIKKVTAHDNADALDIVQILNYECIVKRGQYKEGDLVIFIEPDSQLPDTEWAKIYKAKSNRVRAIRLRNRWSFGIVESFDNIAYAGSNIQEGMDISSDIGVTHWEAPEPQDLSAKGNLPFGIPKTDETRIESMQDSDIPWGQLVDVTLKVDGQSFSAYYRNYQDGDNGSSIDFGVLGRTMEYKLDGNNKYIQNEKQHDVLKKLAQYCTENNVNLCIRGESYGLGIQSFSHNPHAKSPLGLALFSTYLIDERKYARKGSPHYIFDLAPKLGLPTVPLVEKDVKLTPELVKKYSQDLELIDGKPFEGVVINWNNGSAKIINKHYDSKK